MNKALAILVHMALGLVPFLSTPSQAEGSRCHRDDATAICDINNVEDLAKIPGTPWIIGGNLGDEHWKRGGFYLFDTAAKTARPLEFSIQNTTGQAGSNHCPSPPDKALFSSHGIDLRTSEDGKHTLYAINHGGRQSVEIFDLKASEKGVILEWRDCVLIPNSYTANGVTALPDNRFAVTVPATSSDLGTLWDSLTGAITGVTYEWSPDKGWEEVPGGRLAGNNGIRSTQDGKWLFINEYSNGRVTKLSRNVDPPIRETISVGFNPDNLEWENGKILVTGHAGGFLTVVLYCNGTSVKVCPVDTVVAELDPEKFQSKILISIPHDDIFGGGTSSLKVGKELWTSSFRSPSLLIHEFPEPQ